MEVAATKALDLAERLQQLLYYGEGYDLSSKTKVIFNRCYRALKRVVELHFGENHQLYYNPLPGTPFRGSTEAKK